eukprot:2850410-Pleurochrysis_carterae.AAC.1
MRLNALLISCATPCFSVVVFDADGATFRSSVAAFDLTRDVKDLFIVGFVCFLAHVSSRSLRNIRTATCTLTLTNGVLRLLFSNSDGHISSRAQRAISRMKPSSISTNVQPCRSNEDFVTLCRKEKLTKRKFFGSYCNCFKRPFDVKFHSGGHEDTGGFCIVHAHAVVDDRYERSEVTGGERALGVPSLALHPV